jgi:hypothetical protein
METRPVTQATRRGVHRAALLGFAAGFMAAFLVPALALMTTFVETLEPVLVPGALLLEPLSDRMAAWNGLLNLVLAGVANGAVYALAVTAVAFAAGGRRQR